MRSRGMSITPVLVLVLAVLAGGSVAHAQRNDSLLVGARYRATLVYFPDRPNPQQRNDRWISGELVTWRGDSLVLRPHPQTGAVAVPVSAVQRLERSRGTSRIGSGVAGAVGGAIASALLGWNLYEHELRGPGFNTRGQAIGTSAAVGASLGLLAGLIFPSEQWKGVPVPKAP